VFFREFSVTQLTFKALIVKYFCFLLALTTATLMCTDLARAQQEGGSLHGTVIIPSGAPVAQASITVEGSGGGQAATTNADGKYSMSGLTPGNYRLKISAPGFDPFEIDVTVGAGTDREFNAVLMLTPTPAAAPASPETPISGAKAAAPQNQAQPAAPAAQTTEAAQGFSVTPEKGKGALYGVVTDQSGAVIQNSTATATGAGGPVKVSANQRGQYVLNGLAPGQYKITVSSAGFSSFETDVSVTADQAIEIDANLLPLGEKTEVNVEANNVSKVETESSDITSTITEKEVQSIGLNGRVAVALIALAPGVSDQSGQDEHKVGLAGSVKYSVNGGRVEYNNFDVDGSDVLNAGLNGAESTLMVYPSVDAIQEVKVLSGQYSAQYGRTASGTVLVTTKSGTPHLHGNLYDFVRNEFFNARNYFDPPGRAPLYRRQDFGGTIGGPVYIPGVFNQKKDKTFFFWSEEFRLEKSPIGPGFEPGDFNQAVPTLLERGIGLSAASQSACNSLVSNFTPQNGCADFSDVCPSAGTPVDRRLFPDCPTTTIGSGVGNATPIFPIDANSEAILQTGLIPLPNSSGGCNSPLANQVDPVTGQPYMPCYVAAISPPTYWREELGRIDHNFTQNDRLSFRYIHDSWTTNVPTPLWGYVQNSFPTVQNRLNGPGTSMVVRLTDTLSPSLLNEFVVSYVDSHITLKNFSAEGGSLQPIVNASGCSSTSGGTGPYPCIASIFDNGLGGKPPGLVIAGTNAEYGGKGFVVDPSYAPWVHSSPTYSLSDNLSKVIGKHTLQFGVQVVDAQRNETNGAIGAATGDLQGIFTFSNQNSPASSGNAFADFLFGPNGTGVSSVNAIQSYQQDSAQIKYYNDYWVGEPYAQDEWRVNRRLTLNLGVRFSLFGNYHEKNLNAYNWELSAYQAFNQSYTGGLVTIAPPDLPIRPSGTLGGGYLEVGGVPVTIDPSNPTASVMNTVVTRGLVRCGTSGIPASCTTTKLFNPAPRIGFAWDVNGDGKTSIRAGYGLFFEHGTAKEANTGSLEGSAPLDLTMTAPYVPQYNQVGLDANGDHVAFPLDVTSIPAKSDWPYAQQWSLGVQRQLTKDVVASVGYVGSKGTHLSAELQLNQLTPPPTGPDNGIFLNGTPFGPNQPLITNAPGGAGVCSSYGDVAPNSFRVGNIIVTPHEPAYPNLLAACYGFLPTSQVVADPNSLRTYALGFQRVLSLQNIADAQYHALQSTIRRTHGPFTLGVSYTYSHSFDDSSDRSDASFVNSDNLRSSWASSSFDQRHLLNVSYVYALPKVSGALARALSYSGQKDEQAGSTPMPSAASSSALWRSFFDGWEISGITTFQSGTPFTVINSGSSNGISAFDNAGVANDAGDGSYPDVVGSPRAALPPGIERFNPESVGPLLYNPAAFVAPRGLTFGDAGRNFLNNPHRTNFDMSVLKNFKITEGSNLEFRAEGFNVFNHTQFRIFNPNIGNTASNTISCYGGPNYSAIGGLTTYLPGQQPVNVDCTTGSSFLRPVDSHRPRTLQFGLKYSF
jgi:hypothetical protein